MQQHPVSESSDLQGWPVPEPSPELKAEHLSRVLHSEALRGSPNLRRLLEFIASRSLEPAGVELKEYTIGVEALDRNSDFDPKVDTIVRVQIHRLREKLSRYYEEEGREDTVLITIPRGQYTAVFMIADAKPAATPPPPALEEPPAAPPPPVHAPSHPSGRPWTPIATAAVMILITVGAYFYGRRSGLQGTTTVYGRDPQVLRLWADFLGDDTEPIIGYPDAVFLIDESNDLLRFRSGASSQRGSLVEHHLAEEFASNPELARQAGPLYYEDGYTGTGEIESVATLAAIFEDLGAHARIKRSRDITIDDLRTHNVVLLGSSFQNRAVDEFPRQADFQFVKADLRHELWDGAIANLRPLPGESPVYRTERDPGTHALTADYGLVLFQPGLTPGKHVVLLAGLDTTGTAGATQFATSPEGAALVLKNGSDQHRNGKAEPVFQSVVRCTLKDGNSIFGVEPVAVHTVPWQERPHGRTGAVPMP